MKLRWKKKRNKQKKCSTTAKITNTEVTVLIHRTSVEVNEWLWTQVFYIWALLPFIPHCLQLTTTNSTGISICLAGMRSNNNTVLTVLCETWVVRENEPASAIHHTLFAVNTSCYHHGRDEGYYRSCPEVLYTFLYGSVSKSLWLKAYCILNSLCSYCVVTTLVGT